MKCNNKFRALGRPGCSGSRLSLAELAISWALPPSGGAAVLPPSGGAALLLRRPRGFGAFLQMRVVVGVASLVVGVASLVVGVASLVVVVAARLLGNGPVALQRHVVQEALQPVQGDGSVLSVPVRGFRRSALRSHLLNSAPRWTHLLNSAPRWTHLLNSAPRWTHLLNSAPRWTHLLNSAPRWTHLLNRASRWTHLLNSASRWTHLLNSASRWSLWLRSALCGSTTADGERAATLVSTQAGRCSIQLLHHLA
ncbi:hypothetical protein EYF80_053212 [Liparis tanakae]|uniref:Uncharacterized protein n=1 Tax=Liparis tanakae TaxID=230148 RepID=A0A4Z2F621_9TELE|nr:hypothetical protein EYF80_053212 [Liparis tanakae]